MSLNTPRHFQFVDFSPSTDGSSASQRQKIYSHVARDRHARARRLRITDYQRAKEQPQSDPSISKEVEMRDGRGYRSTKNSRGLSINMEVATLPSPVGLLSSDRRDPFESMSSPLMPAEHFLLDHCR